MTLTSQFHQLCQIFQSSGRCLEEPPFEMTRILNILIVVKKETVKIYTAALHKNLNGLHMGTLVSTYDFRHGQTIPVVKETTQ